MIEIFEVKNIKYNRETKMWHYTRKFSDKQNNCDCQLPYKPEKKKIIAQYVKRIGIPAKDYYTNKERK